MSRRPHIAYVCADRGVPIGGTKGASAHVWELAAALQRRGASVHLVAARTSAALNGAVTPGPITDLSADRAVRQMRQTLFLTAPRPAQQAQATEAYGLLLNVALGRELERLHRRWRIDAVYERYSLWSHAAAGFARAHDVPYVVEVNAPLRHEQRRYRILANAAAAASLESYIVRSADHVVVPSAALRPFVVRAGASSARVRVVPNAAHPVAFASGGRRTAREDGTFVVGFLGTLKPWHGLDALVRAFCLLHRRDASYRLLIAGDGPERPAVERQLRHAGLRDAATLIGEVPHARVPEVLATMDVAMAPYPRLRDFYFSPLKVFEYMAAGVPIVASDIGQVGEVLADGRTALLHRPGAVREMAACVARLRHDPGLAMQLGTAARKVLRRRFTWDHNADRVLRLIERSASGHRRGPA